MMGYINQEKWDREVWFKTGDIGQWSLNGSLEVIGRRKNLYRHKNGFLIAPRRIESVYELHPSVEQVFIWGNDRYNHNVGIIVLNKDHITEENSTANEFMVKLNAFGVQHGLVDDELVSAVHIELTNSFTVS